MKEAFDIWISLPDQLKAIHILLFWIVFIKAYSRWFTLNRYLDRTIKKLDAEIASNSKIIADIEKQVKNMEFQKLKR